VRGKQTKATTTMTGEEFERAYAERSGVTVEWLREQGRVARPCHCGEPGCEGWQSVNRESYDEDVRLRTGR
jgi:hypothetical protein